MIVVFMLLLGLPLCDAESDSDLSKNESDFQPGSLLLHSIIISGLKLILLIRVSSKF